MKLFPIRSRSAGSIPKSSASAVLAGVHALVVDDDVDVRRLLRTTLELEGAVVAEADSVRAAVALAERTRFDIVITDITMGQSRRGGVLLRQRLRESSSASAVPVVAMTGCTMLAPELAAAGFDAVLIKPFDVLDLPATIQTLVPSREATAA